VTSAEPGEGKSVLACNLATSIAQSGQRTLLVDADLRRPRVHEYRQQKREPGLSDMVVGQSAGEATIRKSDSEGLWLLTAGTESPNPTELLASRRFGSFVASQDKKFDWIVFDTPPVMPIADATIIAHGADHVVFVVDAEATNRRTAATALERLTESGARVVGVVLNKVDLDGHPYYYSQYYRRDYRRYYQHA
jgi:capsular exopolysaccharide synthesis family protein